MRPLVLLYNWLRLATLNRGYDEDHFGRLAADLGTVMRRLVGEMKALEADVLRSSPDG
jgi:hypothetical protein